MALHDAGAAALDPFLDIAEGTFPVASAIDVWVRDPPAVSSVHDWNRGRATCNRFSTHVVHLLLGFLDCLFYFFSFCLTILYWKIQEYLLRADVLRKR